MTQLKFISDYSNDVCLRVTTDQQSDICLEVIDLRHGVVHPVAHFAATGTRYPGLAGRLIAAFVPEQENGNIWQELNLLKKKNEQLERDLAAEEKRSDGVTDTWQEVSELRASLAAANQRAEDAERRAEDAELVAWGLAKAQHAMPELPYMFWDADGWKLKISYSYRDELLFCTSYYPTLTPDARAALLAAREREEK